MSAAHGHFAALESVNRVPFVRPDGTICQTAGYDPASRTLLVADPDELRTVQVPDDPTGEQVRSAVDLLLGGWLGDMPFATAADRANALALVLTPFVRGHMELTPLAVIDGSQPGVGKNLLADCLAIMLTGRRAEPLPYPRTDEETRKLITSAFATGAPMFVFDEAHQLGGPSLARALTAAIYTDRILGASEMVSYPNKVTWVGLGNNVQVHGDLGRRVYRIALRPAGSSPENRPASNFRHSDLPKWTRENRFRLLEAVLTLVRAWFAAGQPSADRGVRFGSFEAWDEVLGGILHVAGVEGFLENVGQWRDEADYDTADWTAHLEQLRAEFKDQAFTTVEAVVKIQTGAITETPPGMEDLTRSGYGRELGKVYGRVNGRSFGALRLVRAGTRGAGGARGGLCRWAVESPNGGPSDGPEGREGWVGWEGSIPPQRESVSSSPVPDGSPAQAEVAVDPSDPSHTYGSGAVHFHVGEPLVPLTDGATPLQSLDWRDDAGFVSSSTDPAVMRKVLQEADALLTYDGMGTGLVAAAAGLDLPYPMLAGKTRDLLLEARLADPPAEAGSHGSRYRLASLAGRLLPDDAPCRKDAQDEERESVEMVHALGTVITAPDPAYAQREHGIATLAGSLTLTGLAVDEALLQERHQARSGRSAEIRSRLVDEYGFPALAADGTASKRPWATKAGNKLFLDLTGDSDWPKNADGSPVLTADVLRRGAEVYAASPTGEVCQLILEGQAGNSFLDQAAANLVSGRVHPRYGIGTATGRWTSERPNILGVGKRSAALLADRDLILAEDGEVFIGVDLSGIDARCVAGLSGDAAYAKLFDPGVDIHAEMAALFLGDRSLREAAKAISHGINYGRGAPAIADQTHRPLAEVERMHQAYFKRFPGIAAWHRRIRQRGKAGALLPTGTGRLVRVSSDKAHTEAPARLAQAAARDLAMDGVLKVVDAGLLPMLRLFIHDEVVLSVPKDQAEDIAARVAQLMSFTWTSPSGLVIPIVAEPSKSFGPRWSDVYRKPTSP